MQFPANFAQMKNDQTRELRDFRETVILYLLLLTSEESLEALHQLQTPERLAYELARIWFDEVYLPGERYFLGGLKGDISDESITRFREFFSDDELKSMERFHRFFELRIEMLSPSSRIKKIFPQNDSWHHVIKDANYLLQDMIPDSRKKSEELARIIKDVLRDNKRKIAAAYLADLGMFLSRE